jgi:FkbM family methyltransferase
MNALVMDAILRIAPLTLSLPDLGTSVQLSGVVDWLIFADIFANSEYDPGIVAALDSFDFNEISARPFLVVDCGANVGFFALRMLQQAAIRYPALQIQMICVEGSKYVFRRLQRVCAALGSDGRSIRPMYGLVGQKDGLGRLYQGWFHWANSTNKPTGYRRLLRIPSTVPFINLDQELADTGVVDLLKVDIEGSERQFIENYKDLLSRCRVVLIEYHTSMVPREYCDSIVRSCGLQGRELRSCDANAVWLYTRM